MLKGRFFGRILRASLSDGSLTTSDLPDDFAPRYLDGGGIPTRIVCSEDPPYVDPFSPENNFTEDIDREHVCLHQAGIRPGSTTREFQN